MNWLGEQLLGYGKVVQPAQIKRRLREVTAGEIRAVASDFLRPERFNLALVSPLASDRAVARLLDANG
jgi:predicted Zn-dependent peptidase